MNLNELLQIGGGALLLIAAVGVLVGNVYYVIRSKTNKIQKEQIEQLKTDFGNCEAQHRESLRLIHNLQGELKVMKEVPLGELARDMNDIRKTNKEILKTLKASAVTLKKDTKDAKTAVRTVKTDLEKL